MFPRSLMALVATAAVAVASAPAGAVAGDANARAVAEDASARAGADKTRLTFTVADCEGCEVQLHNARRTLDADVVHVWSSKARVVEDGKVTFRMAKRHTRGMSATVRAPWEGHTGYVTTVAWRYNGMQVGDDVTLEEAVTRRRASACWEGTRRRAVTVPLVVEEVEVRGVQGMVPGSIAFVSETLPWLSPMREVWDGVLGSQDVDICR